MHARTTFTGKNHFSANCWHFFVTREEDSTVADILDVAGPVGAVILQHGGPSNLDSVAQPLLVHVLLVHAPKDTKKLGDAEPCLVDSGDSFVLPDLSLAALVNGAKNINVEPLAEPGAAWCIEVDASTTPLANGNGHRVEAIRLWHSDDGMRGGVKSQPGRQGANLELWIAKTLALHIHLRLKRFANFTGGLTQVNATHEGPRSRAWRWRFGTGRAGSRHRCEGKNRDTSEQPTTHCRQILQGMGRHQSGS